MSDSVRPQRRQPTRLSRPWDSPGKNTGMGCHFLLQCMKVKSESEVAQSCPTPSDPMDCSPPGSSVHGICQARVLEWVAKMNRLPIISLAKKGLFGFNEELQFSLQWWWATWKSSHNKEKRTHLKRGKGSWEARVNKEELEELRVQNIIAFHWLSCDYLSLVELLTSKKRKSFFFLLDAAIGLGHEDHPLASWLF